VPDAPAGLLDEPMHVVGAWPAKNTCVAEGRFDLSANSFLNKI